MNGDGNKLYLSQTYDWTNYRHVTSLYEPNGSAWIKLNAEIFIDNYVHSLTCSNNGQIIAIGVPSDDQMVLSLVWCERIIPLMVFLVVKLLTSKYMQTHFFRTRYKHM